jgi:hypothetical protein
MTRARRQLRVLGSKTTRKKTHTTKNNNNNAHCLHKTKTPIYIPEQVVHDDVRVVPQAVGRQKHLAPAALGRRQHIGE